MKVLTLNIGSASLARAEQIFRWIKDRDDDVVVLTETSSGSGTEYLRERYRSARWTVTGVHDDKDRGTVILSRLRTLPSVISTSQITIPTRVAVIRIDAKPRPVSIMGVYVPSRDASEHKIRKKQLFLQSLQETIATCDPNETLILCGDYNVVDRSHTPRIPGLMSFEYEFMDFLHDRGLADAGRACNGGEQYHSWFGRTGDRYCYDYFHVSQDMVSDGARCNYLQETRMIPLTDHAAVELVLPGVDGVAETTLKLAESNQESLFDDI